jgi:murein DD-endopeptidase MepM/ murein hydrolase activator NlpD
MAWRPALAAAVLAVVFAISAPIPATANHPNVAALQVALRGLQLYPGGIDGIAGPQTRGAIRILQRRKRLVADGIVGPLTRRALGRRGRPSLGSRAIRQGQRGWDVAGLQYLLSVRGFSPGSVDGGFGSVTEAAVRRFQRSAGIGVDGVAGSNTLGALRRSGRTAQTSGGPVLFLRPVRGPVTDGFGWVAGRRHTGIDFPVAAGTPVGAAGRGVVRFAGWNSGGYGYLVVVGHRLGFESWYAHLSSIAASPGQTVVGGTRIGSVGSTGRSTGPHLHFEVSHAGTPIDPTPRLLAATAAAAGESGHGGCLEYGSAGRRPGGRAIAPHRRGAADDPAVARLAACRSGR